MLRLSQQDVTIQHPRLETPKPLPAVRRKYSLGKAHLEPDELRDHL